MGPSIVTLTLLLCSAYAIRVPVDWNSDSEVTSDRLVSEESASEAPIPIPVEYFQYPDKKPQFAVEVAAYHDVQNPQEHYSSYPIRPYTGQRKPALGNHKIFKGYNPVFQPLQDFTKINDDEHHVTPSSAQFEVFHPYKAEEPGLQEIYKDPVLDKIRNDIYNTQNRLQNYEKEAGQPNIEKGEYLESPEETDRKKFPHRNVPVPYEIHRPQRRPIYYRPAPNFNRDHVLNQKFRHPWNQYNAKIRPVHYRPLKHQIHKLRQHHAIKFDDEHNQYPQLPPAEEYSEVQDGYDIYERGKAKYVALRNNVDESINNAVEENRPKIYQRLELQNNGDKTVAESGDDDEEFIPVKNYAQVRKTETMKHLPREAAFEDAASFDEIKNAPRLREAIKSTKAQTVYTEEGYEDAAYDHAGEEKHAAENEGHGGYLKEKELSGGKYKTPSQSGKYQDASGNEYRDQTLHGEKWKNDDKDDIHENEEEDYTDDETEKSIEADVYEGVTGERNKRENDSNEKNSNVVNSNVENEEENNSGEVTAERSKRENKVDSGTNADSDASNNTSLEHDVNKRETNSFKIPVLDLNTTLLSGDEILKLAKLKATPKKENLKEKYPYYFKNLRNIHKDSPLRYAENLKFIPKKSKGGTEFYDSRFLECPEVDDDVDALPEKLKKGGHPDSDESDASVESDNEQKTKTKADFSQVKKNQRLGGLGDKIDCFKAKFFGENPLDSPFFKEELISNPEPITKPNLPTYKLLSKEPLEQASTLSNVYNVSEKLKEGAKSDISDLFDKLKGEQANLQQYLVKTNENLKASLASPQNISIINIPQSSIYSDVLESIKNNREISPIRNNDQVVKQLIQDNNNQSNVTYNAFKNKEDVTQIAPAARKKRAAAFIYEPYKIIRDGQVQESKKTTTTSNISPLIKKLQSSRVVDRVTKSIPDDNQEKQNSATRTYKDIGRNDRVKSAKGSYDPPEPRFIDVNVDQRRGEPRYEIMVPNHKPQYAPVTNKKAMSVEDYEAQTNKTIKNSDEKNITTDNSTPVELRSILSPPRHRQKRPTTARPFFDVSQYIPKPSDHQRPSASNTVKQIIKRPNSVGINKQEQQEPKSDEDGDEDYEEYDDEEISTTTTTLKPAFRRRRVKTTTTTAKPTEEPTPYPKLRLITRFHSTQAPITTEKEIVTTEKSALQQTGSENSPKYREKKKKSSKSTLVTDTKTYGDDDDGDLMKDEVDALIGVQQDMEEYTPQYEKENESKRGRKPEASSVSDEEEDGDFEDSDEDEEIDDDVDEDDDDEDESEENESYEPEEEEKPTTPEPTKRTLIRTTEAPISTTETQAAKLELKPIVHKKKIEIHKEIPMNKSSPHITQFKQDIKEVEIIKEMPFKPKANQRLRQRKPQKNIEALELYKDDNLAKEINKLGAVEVFKEDLDLEKGPKHGGNYRSAQLVDKQQSSSTSKPGRIKNPTIIKDPDTSQSENAKLIELSGILPARRLRGGRSQAARLRNSGRTAALELDESAENSEKKLHGGNLKSLKDKGGSKSEKIIELDDEKESDEEDLSDMHGGNFKQYDISRSRGRTLHGGNYRSAKLLADETVTTTEKATKVTATNTRTKAAGLLNSFAQAIPVLTSTPAYILDPSKRMYYYVED